MGEEPLGVLVLTAAAEDAATCVSMHLLASRYSGVSRAEAQRLIEMSPDSPAGIRVNAARVKQNYRIRIGDIVSLVRPTPTSVDSKAKPENIPLDIVFEDSNT